jgi:hypothetical protein
MQEAKKNIFFGHFYGFTKLSFSCRGRVKNSLARLSR